MVEAVVIKNYSQIDYPSQGLVARQGSKGVTIATNAWKLDVNGNKVAEKLCSR